jgi:membrane associated rhomboid family serine protease
MSWYRRQAAPVTIGIIASMIVFAFVWWITSVKGMENFLLSPGWQQRPWTLVTYPWAFMPFFDGLQLLFFVFMIMWMFWTGTSVERDLGSAKYIGLWVLLILVPALFIVTLGPLVGRVGASGMWLPEAALTVIWCLRNQTQEIRLYGVIPLTGKILAVVTVIVNILISGAGNPLFGLVASIHLGIAALFALNMIPFWTYSRGASSFGKTKLSDRPNLKKSERMDKGYYDDVKKREKEREERERLRKMFESSLNDDEGKDR